MTEEYSDRQVFTPEIEAEEYSNQAVGPQSKTQEISTDKAYTKRKKPAPIN